MASLESISQWLVELKAGNLDAAQQLWDRYFPRLVELARLRLIGAPRRAADEEDVALSAFDSFLQGVARKRFPQLSDRNELWRILVTLTARKAVDLIQHETRLKRGGDNGAARGTDWEAVLSREPTPAFAAQLSEEVERRLVQLDEASLRTVAIWKMEGYTVEEIAARLDCAPRTVERKLRVIRSIWQAGADALDDLSSAIS
jgi:DNA-directed RNA polymerase specialized sigma24 family protein